MIQSHHDMPPPFRDLAEAALEQGWRIERCKAHYQWKAPDGIGIVTTAGSASDWRAVKNTSARLKRLGLKL